MKSPYLLQGSDLKFFTTARNYLNTVAIYPKVELHYLVNTDQERFKKYRSWEYYPADFVVCHETTLEIICVMQLEKRPEFVKPLGKILREANITLFTFQKSNYYSLAEFKPVMQFIKEWNER